MPCAATRTCVFLAADFDRSNWLGDAQAFLEACDEFGVPAYLERSRSGRGGHVWIFFDRPLAASLARSLGSAILTRAMDLRPEVGFASYDRFFPSQDTMPKGGFGNLIAPCRRLDGSRKGRYAALCRSPCGLCRPTCCSWARAPPDISGRSSAPAEGSAARAPPGDPRVPGPGQATALEQAMLTPAGLGFAPAPLQRWTGGTVRSSQSHVPSSPRCEPDQRG